MRHTPTRQGSVTHCREMGGQLDLPRRMMARHSPKDSAKPAETQSKVIESQIFHGKPFTQHQPSKQDCAPHRSESHHQRRLSERLPHEIPNPLQPEPSATPPTKELDLNAVFITNAGRILRRMTQGYECNDRMPCSIAKHYITQTRPPRANGPIAIIFKYVHEWGAEIDEHFWFHENRRNESQHTTRSNPNR